MGDTATRRLCRKRKRSATDDAMQNPVRPSYRIASCPQLGLEPSASVGEVPAGTSPSQQQPVCSHPKLHSPYTQSTPHVNASFQSYT